MLQKDLNFYKLNTLMVSTDVLSAGDNFSSQVDVVGNAIGFIIDMATETGGVVLEFLIEGSNNGSTWFSVPKSVGVGSVAGSTNPTETAFSISGMGGFNFVRMNVKVTGAPTGGVTVVSYQEPNYSEDINSSAGGLPI